MADWRRMGRWWKRYRSAGLLFFLTWLGVTGFSFWLIPVQPRASFTLNKGDGFLQFSPDSKMLVTAYCPERNAGGTLRGWDVATGRQRWTLAEGKEVNTVAFSPDSTLLAGYLPGDEGGVKVWETATGKELLERHTQWGDFLPFCFSPDGRFLLLSLYRRREPDKDLVQCWDLRQGQERATLEPYINGMVFSPDGQRLITWGQRNLDGQYRSVEMWQMGDGEALFRLRKHHQVSADKLAFSPDRTIFATASYAEKPDGRANLEIRDTDSGAVRCSFSYEDKGKHIESLSFSPDGKFLQADSGGGTKYRNWQTRSTLWDVSGTTARWLRSFAARPVFSPDSRRVVVPTEKGAELYDVDSGQGPAVLQQPEDYLWIGEIDGVKAYPAVAFSPDETMVAVAGLFCRSEQSRFGEWFSEYVFKHPPRENEPIARLWDVRTGREFTNFADCTSIQFSPDGRTMATLLSDGQVQLWEIPLRKPLGQIAGWTLSVWLVLLGGLLYLRWARRRRGRAAGLAGEQKAIA